MAWQTIAAADIDPGSPGSASLFDKLANNPKTAHNDFQAVPIKTASQSLNTSTTLTNITGLTWTQTEENEAWRFSIHIPWEHNGGGIRFGIQVSNASQIIFNGLCHGRGPAENYLHPNEAYSASTSQLTLTYPSTLSSAAATTWQAILKGIVINPIASTIVTLQFAQDTSNGGNTTICPSASACFVDASRYDNVV